MLLSFIIPTFNSQRCVRTCLDSIVSQKGEDVEICVIDNGSTDLTPKIIQRDYPTIRLLCNDKNKGSCFARNQGIAATYGTYIIFLDSDARLSPDFIKILRPKLQGLNEACAGLTPKIIQADNGKIFSCGLRVDALYRSHDLGQKKSSLSMRRSRKVGGFNSCCAVLRRSFLQEATEKKQCFDEAFFFLFEDTDLSVRLRKRGYHFLYDPELLCFHRGGGAPIDLARRRFYTFRNRLFMIFKNEKNIGGFFLRSFFYDIPRTLHFFLTNPYADETWRDVVRKFQDEKNTDF